MNNWQKSAALYRKRQWRRYRKGRNGHLELGLPFISGDHVIIEDDPCPYCKRAADLAELYGAFERTIDRCADG